MAGTEYFIVLAWLIQVVLSIHGHYNQYTFLLSDREQLCFTEEFHDDDVANYTLSYTILRGVICPFMTVLELSSVHFPLVALISSTL